MLLRSSLPAAFHQLGEPACPIRLGGALIRFDHVQDGVDERQVRERLGEVAEVTSRSSGRALRRRARARSPRRSTSRSSSRARSSSPISTSAETSQNEQTVKRPLALAVDAVVGLLGAVAVDEGSVGQVVGDREHRRADPLVVRSARSRAWAAAAATRRARRSVGLGEAAAVARRRSRRRRRGSPGPRATTRRPAPSRRAAPRGARRGRPRPST